MINLCEHYYNTFYLYQLILNLRKHHASTLHFDFISDPQAKQRRKYT